MMKSRYLTFVLTLTIFLIKKINHRKLVVHGWFSVLQYSKIRPFTSMLKLMF